MLQDEKQHDFLIGFAAALDVPISLAAKMWQEYSVFIRAAERKSYESGGRQEGLTQGDGLKHLLVAIPEIKSESWMTIG